MKLAYWMYAGPAHIGTLRVASSFKNVHAIMHAPLGDDYFNVMRSMLERERDFTPVTASIVDRHVLARGSQNKVVENIVRKDKEEKPDLIILTPTCTSSILQEDLQNFVERASMESKCDLILADVNHYRVNELQAADRTLEQVVRFYIEKAKKQGRLKETKTKQISANILGIFTLGFHNQHDCRELEKLLHDLGIAVNLIIPENGSVNELHKLPEAHFNIVPYREYGLMAGNYLLKEFDMPLISTTPMGIVDTAIFIREIANVIQNLKSKRGGQSDSAGNDGRPLTPQGGQTFPASKARREAKGFLIPQRDQTLHSQSQSESNTKPPHSPMELPEEMSRFNSASALLEKPDLESKEIINFEEYIDKQSRFVSQAAWFSRSIDCQNLTGKKTVVFGDSTHAASMTRILAREMGVRVSCAGTYCKQDADWFREQVQAFCDSVLITDDHTQVADMIARVEPAAIFGTQMERHIGKRLDIPCGVISSPVHIQNFSLGYRPFLGYEGANQIADLVYNSFTLGMEDHLLEIFGGHDTKQVITKELSNQTDLNWAPEALTELKKIPGFVRGRIKRNTEKFARDQKVNTITVSVMYAAKEAAGA